MYLYIDTSKKDTEVALYDQEMSKVDCLKKDGAKNQSENLLILIDKALTNNKIKKENLRGIFVFKGPGSYTGLRVGIATANALSEALDINILAVDSMPSPSDLKSLKDAKQKARPKYSYPPKITKENPRL